MISARKMSCCITSSAYANSVRDPITDKLLGATGIRVKSNPEDYGVYDVTFKEWSCNGLFTDCLDDFNSSPVAVKFAFYEHDEGSFSLR